MRIHRAQKTNMWSLLQPRCPPTSGPSPEPPASRFSLSRSMCYAARATISELLLSVPSASSRWMDLHTRSPITCRAQRILSVPSASSHWMDLHTHGSDRGVGVFPFHGRSHRRLACLPETFAFLCTDFNKNTRKQEKSMEKA